MAHAKLTKKFIESLPLMTKGQVIYWDTELSGFGVCVGRTAKSYVVQRDINGRPKRVTIGKHGVWWPENARREAQELLLKMSKGIDPHFERKAQSLKSKTVQAAYDEYVRSGEKRLAAGTIVNYHDFIQNHYSDWQKRLLHEISRDMIIKRHEVLTERCGASSANASMQFLRAVFNFAMIEDENLANPVLILSKKKLWNDVKRRTSYIKDNQMRSWHEAVMDLQNQTIKDAFRLLLFTGLRRMEAFRMRWEHVNFDERIFIIPHTKNGRSHELPMSDFIFDLLQRRQKDSGSSPWVFPGEGKDGHLTEPRAAIKAIIKRTGFKFMPHDLRRTFITIAERLDISSYALKRMLNHTSGSDVTAGYIVIETERLRAPMEAISNEILKLVEKDRSPSTRL